MNSTQIAEKLGKLPEEFGAAYAAGQWCRAAMIYEEALLVSRVLQMDTETRERLIYTFDPEEVRQAYIKAGWYKETDEDAKRESDYRMAV